MRGTPEYSEGDKIRIDHCLSETGLWSYDFDGSSGTITGIDYNDTEDCWIYKIEIDELVNKHPDEMPDDRLKRYMNMGRVWIREPCVHLVTEDQEDGITYEDFDKMWG